MVDTNRIVPVSTWSDALDRLGMAGIMTGLRRVSGDAAFAGRAVTVSEDVGQHPPEAFDVASVIRALGEGTVLVIDAGGAAVSTFGGLFARAARRRGVSGVIVDGGCRDVDEIRAAGVNVYSRHVTPVSGKGRLRVTGINVAIDCGGVRLCAGDFVVADHTGIAVVPAEQYDAVASVAHDIDARDTAFAAALEAGAEFGAIARKLGHL
jgi:regulator of RNase E activity RraA